MNLFKRVHAPEDDLGGGGADLGGEVDSAAVATDSAPSMEDTIRDKFRELTADAPADEPDETGDTPRHTTQPRDKGRFTKAPTEGAEDATQATPTEEPPANAQLKPHDQLPNTWRKELADEWKALPERTRQEIHRREQDMHNGLKQYRDAAGFGQSIAREMQPYQQLLQQRGVTPQAVVRDIMSSLSTMATGSDQTKAEVLLQLARGYGINLDTVMSLHSRAPSQAAPDLSPVLQRVQQIESRISQADQEREYRQQAEDDATVTRFLNDPKNEHAKSVQQQMAALLSSGQVKDLADAYEQAIWLHPEVRQQLLQKQEAERRKKDEDAAKAARKAAATNVQRRGTPPAAAPKGTMEDTIRARYRQLTN